MLEHAARAAWVVDGPNSEARIARALLARLVATADDVRTADEAGDGPAVMFNARERLSQLVETTIPELLGTGPDLGKPGTHSVHYKLAGESYGTVRDVVDGFVHRYFPGHNGTVFYRIASILAHPNTSGAFVFVTEEADGSATTVTPVEHVANRTVAALRAWQVANQRVCVYLGWRAEQEPEWSALVDTLDRATSHRRDAVRVAGAGGRDAGEEPDSDTGTANSSE